MGYGPVELAGDLVQGGWDAVVNITSGIGKGAEALISPFFPSPQKQGPTVSEINEPMGAAGKTFRQTIPENQSMIETNAMYADQNFLGTQYEERFNTPAKVAESKQLSASVSKKDADWIGGGLDWALETSASIVTVVDEFMKLWGLKPREPISEGEKEIGNSPGTITHLQKEIGKGVETIKKAGAGMLGQIKGLFGIGFGGPGGNQPVLGIKHELEPSGKTTIGIAVVVAIVVLLLWRKK